MESAIVPIYRRDRKERQHSTPRTPSICSRSTQESHVSNATESKCPFHHASGGGTSNKAWWPNHVPLDLLHQHSAKSNPMGTDFDYARAFKTLDLAALK